MAQRGHEIQGMVTELIFSNEANGYKVCEVELEDERITVVGILPDVQPGESIAATGAWKQHLSLIHISALISVLSVITAGFRHFNFRPPNFRMRKRKKK